MNKVTLMPVILTKVILGLIFISLISCDGKQKTLPSNLTYDPESIELKQGEYVDSPIPTIEGTSPFNFSLLPTSDIKDFVFIDVTNGQISIDGTKAPAGEYMVWIEVENEVGKAFFEDAFSFSVIPRTVEEQLAIDLELIDDWIANNGITDILYHSSGIRYTINRKGNGARAQIGDVVRTSYEGRILTSSKIIDNSTEDFYLSNGSLILGWVYMLQEMDEGDDFTIYLPSKYAYGVNGGGSVPPNTVIVFDIELIKINP